MIEIEKKFLVTSDRWKEGILSEKKITQFYISAPEAIPTVRLRLLEDVGYLTLKYPSTSKNVLVRPEFEYEVPKAHVIAQQQFAIGNIIEKTRYEVRDTFGQHWDVDEFTSPNTGLVLAEIELAEEKAEISLPDWVGEDVSDNSRYSNQVMSYQSPE
ncbi:CYTH domain-containing protein [Sneathiella sp. P13V-1]|uniref:CYTH domain-containing protein n=1 Tax=Sneathiella sp. P13V-1 TaxID=2697366 RepID=UPI00187B47E9|nr:CYTH domain-containing protein [Sneathiella sp. P13V-1]MBE7636371.1 CYTH domain-containing protein [Sneathiella sp. P13V-1]